MVITAISIIMVRIILPALGRMYTTSPGILEALRVGVGQTEKGEARQQGISESCTSVHLAGCEQPSTSCKFRRLYS